MNLTQNLLLKSTFSVKENVKSGMRRGKPNAYCTLVFSLVEKLFTDSSSRQFLAKDFYQQPVCLSIPGSPHVKTSKRSHSRILNTQPGDPSGCLKI